MVAEFRNPEAIVSCEWLADHLDTPGLRIFDCTTYLEFQTDGDRPYLVKGAGEEHAAGHIPGAAYLDLQGDFSLQDSPWGMTLEAPENVADAFARAGVDQSSRVILYSRTSPAWATRFWWMLRWIGFDNAAILDGGFTRWSQLGNPVSTTSDPYPPGKLIPHPRPGLFVGKEEVLAALDKPETCLVNALGRDVFSGENPRYGRPGHIPGSVNIPKAELVDPKTQMFLPAATIAAIIADTGADKAAHHIAYCGGGIFATTDAFMLYQLGHDFVSVYDNSLSEWGPDESLPIATAIP